VEDVRSRNRLAEPALARLVEIDASDILKRIFLPLSVELVI
jgi:hypothetical protein